MLTEENKENSASEAMTSSDTNSTQKSKTLAKEKVTFFFRIKRFCFGLVKESKRVSWARPKDLGIGMITVLIIMILLTAIFFGIAQLVILTGAVN